MTVGAYIRTKVACTPDGKIGKVTSLNQVNPQASSNADFACESKPGAAVLHEVTEGYQAAKMSQANGYSSGDSNTPGSVYKAAHNAPTPQSSPGCELTMQSYDQTGKPVPFESGQATCVDVTGGVKRRLL